MLTTFGMDRYVVESLRAGASGFLLKTVPPDELVMRIVTVREERRCSHRPSFVGR
jgi:DNA-binding NarL/FixJ family response regulator